MICSKFTVLLVSGERIAIYTLSQDARDDVNHKLHSLACLAHTFEEECKFDKTTDISIMYNHDSLLRVCLTSRGFAGYTEEETVLREKDDKDVAE